MNPSSIFIIGTSKITVHAKGTLIEFADGTTVPGEPEDTDSYRQTAHCYGYDTDTLALCIDHEIMHVALAHWLGLDSPTMRAVRSNKPHDDLQLREKEETAVLALQAYARAIGVDLVKLFDWQED